LSCFLAVVGLGFAGTYSGGDGSSANPFQINSVADWQELMTTSADWDKHFILTSNIDFEGVTITPVAPDTTPTTSSFTGTPFTGSFDGQGFKLNNIVINQPNYYYVGIFGCLGTYGQINNLKVENVDITGNIYVGGLAGENSYGIITLCSVKGQIRGSSVGGLVGRNYFGTISTSSADGTVSGGISVGGIVGWDYCGKFTSCYATNSIFADSYYSFCIGGLIGYTYSGKIVSCFATGTVYATDVISGGDSIGGLVGYSYSGNIEYCYATGSVIANNGRSVGGLVGFNNGIISSCYAGGQVSGSVYVGGLVGECSTGYIRFSYSTGFVSGSPPVGGLIGYNSYGSVTSCFWDTQTSCQSSSGGGIGLNTEQMKTMSIFQNAGWAGKGWVINDGFDYPRLSWEDTIGLPIQSAEPVPLAGEGTEENPYVVCTAHEFSLLHWYSDILDKHIKLTADLDLYDIILYPIGSPGQPFVGVFDGNNHIVSNVTINLPNNSRVGIFGCLGDGGQIKNFGIENVNVIGSSYVGGLVGGVTSYYSTIEFCYVTGSVSGTGYSVGGLVGENTGTIISSNSTVSVNGYGNYTGGLVGYNSGTITLCHTTGNVTGTSNSVGGLVGRNYGTITSSYAKGLVSGEDYVGGLVGYNAWYHSSSEIFITDNYVSGIVNATGDFIGELTGKSDTPITVEGDVSINSSNGVFNHRWKNLVLQGSGTLNLSPDVTLNLSNSTVSCNIAGTGTIQVDLDTETVIEGNAVIDLAHPTDPNTNGRIQCDGLLRVKDNVQMRNANITVTRSSFEGDVNISNSVITAEAGSPYGQFFIEDTVRIEDNHIHADGDRYMDLDPSIFAGLIANNKIYVTITEGVGNTRGGLFELRGDPNLADTPCPPDEFYCQLANIPEFDTQSWTLERLTLVDGAKLNLTNRFDFGNGGHNEVLYVKELILGENSQLNTAFNRLYYGSLDGDPSCFKNKPLLGFSLNNVACNDDNEFVTRIVHNNYIDRNPNPPDYTRIHVARVVGEQPDPAGMIRMRNLTDTDPSSSTYNQVVNARAKALFAKASEDRILIHFEYLFESDDPSVQLVIYLSDHATIMNHSNPSFTNHYLEVARLLPPLPGQPGSVGSGRFGVFNREFSRRDLNFIRGTRIEFELIGPDGAGILIDNWDPQVYCSELYCSDIDGDTGINELDFLTILGTLGETAGITQGNNSRACLDGAFSRDGYVNLHDTITWDWLLNTDSERPDHMCGTCLSTQEPGCVAYSMTRLPPQTPPVYFQSPLTGLLVAGKRGALADKEKKNDMLASISSSGQRVDTALLNKRTNSKLVMSPDARLYQVNAEEGLIRLADSNSIIPCAAIPIFSESRYGRSAVVYVGLQKQDNIWYGRPISDAAFDNEGYVYVVPVVIDPVIPDPNKPPYLAAAKLQLNSNLTPPYSLQMLYDDDPYAANPRDNRNLTGLRELEVDGQGNLYLLNIHRDNESNIIWKYDTATGELINSVILDNDANIPAPIGMHVSDVAQTLYLASSQNAAEADSTFVYGLDINTLEALRRITIHNMGHVTDITENPATGRVYVSGIKMSNIPEYLKRNDMPFYSARLAEIPLGYNSVTAIDISGFYGDPNSHDPNNHLALPLSILFLGEDGEDPCHGADLDGGGRVDMSDFAILAAQWLSIPGVPSADIAPISNKDDFVDILDLVLFAENWLRTGCAGP
jgi:hypothetical protein